MTLGSRLGCPESKERFVKFISVSSGAIELGLSEWFGDEYRTEYQVKEALREICPAGEYKHANGTMYTVSYRIDDGDWVITDSNYDNWRLRNQLKNGE